MPADYVLASWASKLRSPVLIPENARALDPYPIFLVMPCHPSLDMQKYYQFCRLYTHIKWFNHVKSCKLHILARKISTHLDGKTHTYVGIETHVVYIKHRSIGFWWQNPIFCSSFTLFRIVKSKHVVCQRSQPVAFSVWNPICCNWNPTRTPANHCCPETFCGVLVSDMKSQGLPLRLWNEWTWSSGAQLENIETIWYEYMLCLLCIGLSENLLVYARMEGYPKTVI